jgi:Calcium-activated chloride channel
MSILSDCDSLVGCRLDLNRLQSNGSLLHFFPLRDKQHCERLLAPVLLPFRVKTWQLPIDDLRDYFGEKIAMYFDFLGFYTSTLLPLGILGVVVMIDVFAESDGKDGGLAYGFGHASLIPPYGLLICEYESDLLLKRNCHNLTRISTPGINSVYLHPRTVTI